MHCCLCGTSLLPGKRALLKEKEEELECIVDILKEKYVIENEEEVKTCLKTGAVCRRKCQTNLNRLVKLKEEIRNLECEVKDNVGRFVTSNGLVLNEILLNSEDDTTSPPAAQQRLEPQAQTPKRWTKNDSSIGVSTILYTLPLI